MVFTLAGIVQSIQTIRQVNRPMDDLDAVRYQAYMAQDALYRQILNWSINPPLVLLPKELWYPEGI